MRIVVTGATSVLGRLLVRALVSRGHEVTAFVRSSGKIAELPAHIRIVYGDVRDVDALKAAMAGSDHVFHMACMMRCHPRRRSDYEVINVGGLRDAIRLAGEAGVARFIYTSSFYALGPSGERPLTEGDSGGSHEFLGDFDRSVTLGDRVARAAAQQGSPIVVLYPGVMYGPGEAPEGYGVAAQILEFLQGGFRGFPFGGRTVRSYSFLPDIVAGHIAALEKASLGEGYILGGENVSLEDFYDIVSELTEIPLPSRIDHSWKPGFRVIAKNIFQALSGKTPSSSPEEIDMLRLNWACSSAKAERKLGYRITTLREGLKQTLRWLRERSAPGNPPEPAC
jgi:farnesol dehydrogenase